MDGATGRVTVLLWIMRIRFAFAPAKNNSLISNGNGLVSSYGDPMIVEVNA